MNVENQQTEESLISGLVPNFLNLNEGMVAFLVPALDDEYVVGGGGWEHCNEYIQKGKQRGSVGKRKKKTQMFHQQQHCTDRLTRWM